MTFVLRRAIIIVVIFKTMLDLVACTSSSIDKIEIINKKWVTSSCVSSEPVDINNRGKASTDLLSQGSACELDDIIIFNEGNDLIIDNGALTCDLPKIMKGNWSFVGEDSIIIHFPLSDEPYRFKIISISKSKIVLKTKLPFLPENIDVIYTFSKTD